MTDLLIDFDRKPEIQIDYNAHTRKSPPKSLQAKQEENWALYPSKPVSQDHWEELVRTAAAEIVDTDEFERAVAAAKTPAKTPAHTFLITTPASGYCWTRAQS